jgi:hypothetical protein
MNSENYTIDTAADAFSTSTRNIRSLIQREIIPRTIEIEGQKAWQLLPDLHIMSKTKLNILIQNI